MDDLAEKQTILIVDDSPEIIDSLCLLLKPAYRVKVALSGEKALSVVAKSAPDLILLDVMMPGMDGVEVCRRLKRDPATSAIPLVFVSGTASDSNQEQALGAAAVILKPVDPALLKSTIKTCLSGCP